MRKETPEQRARYVKQMRRRMEKLLRDNEKEIYARFNNLKGINKDIKETYLRFMASEIYIKTREYRSTYPNDHKLVGGINFARYGAQLAFFDMNNRPSILSPSLFWHGAGKTFSELNQDPTANLLVGKLRAVEFCFQEIYANVDDL